MQQPAALFRLMFVTVINIHHFKIAELLLIN
jgi:hypothetical protein